MQSLSWFLSLVLFSTDDGRLELSRQYALHGDYERCAQTLKTVTPSPENQSDYYYYQMISAFSLNHKKDTLKSLEYLEGCVMPDRYRAMMVMIGSEVKEWKNDDLSEIARDMKIVKDRLAIAKGGKKTIEIENDIVKKLDKMIKDMEDEANKGGGGSGGKGDQTEKGGKKEDGPGGKGDPKNDSTPGSDSGPGAVDNKRLRGMAEQWGKLPEKERAKAMADLCRDLPARYRQEIEEYFKKMAQAQK